MQPEAVPVFTYGLRKLQRSPPVRVRCVGFYEGSPTPRSRGTLSAWLSSLLMGMPQKWWEVTSKSRSQKMETPVCQPVLSLECLPACSGKATCTELPYREDPTGCWPQSAKNWDQQSNRPWGTESCPQPPKWARRQVHQQLNPPKTLAPGDTVTGENLAKLCPEAWPPETVLVNDGG